MRKRELSGTTCSVLACKMVSKRAIHQDGEDQGRATGGEGRREVDADSSLRYILWIFFQRAKICTSGMKPEYIRHLRENVK